MGQPQVFRHLRILSGEGLVRVHRKAQHPIDRREASSFQEIDVCFVPTGTNTEVKPLPAWASYKRIAILPEALAQADPE